MVAAASVAIVALVVTPSSPRAPLFTAGAAASPNAASLPEGAASSDMRVGMWIDYRYTAGAGLATDGGSGNVYKLERTGTVESRVAEIGSTFGIDGEPAPSEFSDPAYPTWSLGPIDGTAPSVSVTWAGTGDWWYNNPTAGPFYECAAIEPGESCGDGEEPPVVSAAPAEAEARSLAQQLFRSTGFEPDADQIEVVADEWQTTATAHLEVDGIATALNWSVSWSNTGEISWASGHSITVQDRGAYDTISASESVDRLADGRWFGAPGPDYQGDAVLFAADSGRAGPLTDVEPGVEPTAEPIEPSVTPEPAPDPETVPTAEPAPETVPEPVPGDQPPVEPTPIAPEVVEVTVDEAEATLLLMWDSDGNAWLVPGFAMRMPEGWWNSMVSLVPGVIELPEPIVLNPLVGEVDSSTQD
jgi:hypothetical protein